MSYWTLVYGLSALLATAAFIILVRKPACSIGLIDAPGGRKQHEAAVPLCGGPAIAIAFVLLVVIFGALPSTRYMGLVMGVALLALVGCWDDLRDLSARRRFAAQSLIVLLCIEWLGNMGLGSLGNLFGGGDVDLGPAAIPFTIFCVVGIINAVNLVDGIDGLAGGLTVIAFSCFGGVALATGRIGIFVLLVLLIGGALGFLLFNLRTRWRQRASVFLGDSGSTVLGFILCWFAIDLTQGAQPEIAPITAVWILALPIMDTVTVMLSRALRGDRPFSPSREHLHHAVLALGYSPRRTVWILLTLAAILSGTGLAGDVLQVKEWAATLGFVGLWIVYFFAMRRFWRRHARVAKGDHRDTPRPSLRDVMRECVVAPPIGHVLDVASPAGIASPSIDADSPAAAVIARGDTRALPNVTRLHRRPEASASTTPHETPAGTHRQARARHRF